MRKTIKRMIITASSIDATTLKKAYTLLAIQCSLPKKDCSNNPDFRDCLELLEKIGEGDLNDTMEDLKCLLAAVSFDYDSFFSTNKQTNKQTNLNQFHPWSPVPQPATPQQRFSQ